MPIKLIIFDLDGTLVDTSEDITNALNYAIKPYGIKGLKVTDTIKMVGEGITRLIEKVLGEDKSHLKDDVVKRFLDYYEEHLTDYSTAYPEVKETLEKLEGYRKAVISNKRESLSRELLKRLGILGFFDMVVGSDTTAEKKPSPVPVLHVLSRLGTFPSQAVIVGDSNLDIEAGKKAGIKTVAVTYGYREKHQLVSADYMIDSLTGLINLLYETEDMLERRKEKRHPVPHIYQKYIGLRIKHNEDFLPVGLLDLSEHGVRIKSPVKFSAGSVIECIVSIPESLTKEVAFKAKIRHWLKEDDSFILGAEIEEVEDRVWFRVFRKVHDFISEKPYFHETDD